MDDIRLLQRVAARDLTAFDILYTQYAPRVSSFLSRLLDREDLIEEVRNDVMLAIWQHAGSFKRTSRLSTWIFGIARNKALYARKRSASRPVSSDLEKTEAIDWDKARTLNRKPIPALHSRSLKSTSASRGTRSTTRWCRPPARGRAGRGARWSRTTAGSSRSARTGRA